MADPQPWRIGLPRLAGGVEDRFAGYDVLDQLDTWDDVTAAVVLGRLAPPGPLRFFTTNEERTGRALVDRLLAQDEEPRIPVLDMIDARLAAHQTDGWHYDNLPPDAEAWPDTLAQGAEIRADAFVSRIVLGDDGRATGVVYWREGVERFQRARLVAVAGYSIETPRLLLNSACSRFPDGLCNNEDLVGRYLMVQGAPQTAGRFDEEVRMYKTPPPGVSSEAFYETDPSKDYKRGFSVQTVSPLPITWAEHVGAEGHWGHVLREYMRDYVHWMCLGVLCEFLPLPGNRVTLSAETDHRDERVAHVDYSQCDNDRALMAAGQAVMERILDAAGADDTVTIKRYAHLVGGCRMGVDAASGVVDADLRSFAVPNLYITDGSVLPTQGSANPALTIMAVAARCAHRLISANRG